MSFIPLRSIPTYSSSSAFVGETEGEGVDVVQVLTGDFDFDEIAGLVRLDVGREHERTAHLVGRVALHHHRVPTATVEMS